MAQLYNVCIRVISSLRRQAAVDINPGNTQQQTLILGHYAKGQGDHYMIIHNARALILIQGEIYVLR